MADNTERTREELLNELFEDRLSFSEIKVALSTGLLLEDDFLEKRKRREMQDISESLCEKWEVLLSNDSETHKFFRKKEVMDYDAPKRHEHFIEEFRFFVENGLFPPPEVLLDLYKCLRDYFVSCGEKSLDQAFFGSDHVRTKSLAYKLSKGDRSAKCRIFHFFVLKEEELAKTEGRRKKLLKTLAHEYLLHQSRGKKLNKGQTETLLEYYKIWKREELPKLED